jgi:broad specificity phosphatase PhoE
VRGDEQNTLLADSSMISRRIQTAQLFAGLIAMPVIVQLPGHTEIFVSY